jgi:hypothetical protein
MTSRHDESLTISMQILSEAGYTHARSNVEEIATLVRSLSSGRGVYVPREAISDVMLRLRYLANRIYGQQVANDEFASIIADLAALTPPTGDRK